MTKTYNYVFEGTPGSVDVTVFLSSCNIQSGPNPGESSGVLTANITLSQALPFELLVRLSVAFTQLTSTGTFSTTFIKGVNVPVGLTSHLETGLQCYKEVPEPYERLTFVYTFADQQYAQIIGSNLAAEVVSISNATCFGQANGSVQVQATGGSGVYNYAWSDGGANSSVRGSLPAGTYSVVITDTASNSVTLTGIVVGQPSGVTLATAINPVTCFGGSNGSVAITPSGGTAPYTYSWSDGSSQQNRSGLSAGVYTVTVRDGNGCNQSFPITIPQPAQLTITINQSGKNVTNVIAGGTAPYAYLWSDGFITKDRTNLENGVYTFTVTDANGCSQSTVIVIQDFKFFFSKNPIWLSLQATNVIAKENLSFVCEVFLEQAYKSENFAKIYESEQPGKINGSTDFNVEQVLNSYLDSRVPAFNEMIVKQVSEAFKRFYLQSFEKFGTPPEPSATTQVETFYVLFGGLSEQEFAKQTFFQSYLDSRRPFLSWQPIGIPLASDQHAYLHFVANNPSFNTLVLRATVYYDDDTNVESNVKTVNNVGPFEVYRFPAGLTQLQLQNLNPAKKIKSYSLQLFSGANEASQVRTYEVITPKAHFKRLLFLNSLGGWDSLLCFGRGKRTLRTGEESINRDLPVGYRYSDREEQTVSKTGTMTGSLVIAIMSGNQREHLIDLAISEKVYLQTASGYLPVQVKFDFDPSDDFENLDEIGLDILYPKIRRYTPEL